MYVCVVDRGVHGGEEGKAEGVADLDSSNRSVSACFFLSFFFFSSLFFSFLFVSASGPGLLQAHGGRCPSAPLCCSSNYRRVAYDTTPPGQHRSWIRRSDRKEPSYHTSVCFGVLFIPSLSLSVWSARSISDLSFVYAQLLA